MGYFDEITDRFDTNSLKWNCARGELAMWVADMDFPTAPKVREAIENKAKKGIFGYVEIPDEFFEAYISWWDKYHGIKFDKNFMLYASGVIGILASAIRRLTKVGDKIVVQSPVYGVFFNEIRNNDREICENRLIYANGKYSVDWADLEDKLSDEKTTMMILCNPHNPCGICWDLADLNRVANLCQKYGVVVFSDEIHCDITQSEYHSFGLTNFDDYIIGLSTSKAFNLASIHSAVAVCGNERLKNIMQKALNDDEIAEPSAFCVEATLAAFESRGYIDELNKYIAQNKRIAKEFIEQKCELKVAFSEASYLLWVELGGADTDEFCKALRAQTGLWLSNGSFFGGNGKNFVRINVATQRQRLRDGLERLYKFIKPNLL